MKYIRLIITLLFISNGFFANAQCDYLLESFSHNDCNGDNKASIEISITNLNATATWNGPNGFTSSSSTLFNLYSGTYYLTITNLVLGCTLIDSIEIQETIKISAEFSLTGRCNNLDSVDVITNIWGGTPPYSCIWSNGNIEPSAFNLPPTSIFPNVLTVTDANLCVDTIHLWVRDLNEMNSFMSSQGVKCKDDNTGNARVYVEGGTPPFIFNWQSNNQSFIQQDDILEIDSFSKISGLYPGVFLVEIIDDMGCIIEDSIEVKSNPSTCIKIYKAFSPNDDDIHEFWEIENIHLYPDALVSVYDRNGRQVFNRRNYINSEDNAFGGKDINNQPLPSDTYFYVIDLDNKDERFKGTVTIIR